MTQQFQRFTRMALSAMLGAAGMLVAANTPAKADLFNVTYEAAGVQNADTTALCANIGLGTCTIGVESFTGRTSGSAFSTDFGISGANTITGLYSPVQINAADQYGGANGTGNYPVAFGTPFDVALTTTAPTGLNYFGFWLSALDSGNQVEFFKNNVLVYNFSPNDLIAALGTCDGSNPYCGNPSTTYHVNSGQLYAFVNFFDTNGTFDDVKFSENPSNGGYESDNHTVGFIAVETGTPVPEPASLAILGAALAGLGVIRRNRA
jgi:PEP-CTERM motif